MRLLLGSDGSFLMQTGYALLGIPVREFRIGYVITAAKVSTNIVFLETHRRAMTEGGYAYEEFDIEGKSEEEMLRFFEDKNVVHLEGGNSFFLMRIIRESGFEKVLRILLERGLVFIGTSAGAYVMCPDLLVSTWGRHTNKRFGLEGIEALNYVPFCLKVHYTDRMAEELKERVKSLPCPLRILRDGQGIYVHDGKCTFVGRGEEVRLE